MKIVDIADEIFRELGEPSTISIPAISFWIRSNVGELNNRINTTFKINEIMDLRLTSILGVLFLPITNLRLSMKAKERPGTFGKRG